MTHPWWWYLPVVGYLVIAHRCRRSQQAVSAYHDRGEAAPTILMDLNREAYQATFGALTYTCWALAVALAACLLGVILAQISR